MRSNRRWLPFDHAVIEAVSEASHSDARTTQYSGVSPTICGATCLYAGSPAADRVRVDMTARTINPAGARMS
jgi:hypothetical protein